MFDTPSTFIDIGLCQYKGPFECYAVISDPNIVAKTKNTTGFWNKL